MKSVVTRAAICVLILSISISGLPLLAQETKPPAPPAEKKAEKPRTAASLECSKEADTKGVHGKERKKFMSECKKAAKDAAPKAK